MPVPETKMLSPTPEAKTALVDNSNPVGALTPIPVVRSAPLTLKLEEDDAVP